MLADCRSGESPQLDGKPGWIGGDLIGKLTGMGPLLSLSPGALLVYPLHCNKGKESPPLQGDTQILDLMADPPRAVIEVGVEDVDSLFLGGDFYGGLDHFPCRKMAQALFGQRL